MTETDVRASAVQIPHGAWDIRFSFDNGRRETGWRWTGKAKLWIEAGTLRIAGRRNRPFWVAAKQDVSIPLVSVRNVAHDGSAVQLECVGSISEKPIVFSVADVTTAAAIVSALPTERTLAFNRLREDREAFDASIEAVGDVVWVTPALVAINVLVFVLTAFMGAGWLTPDGSVLIQWGSNYSPLTYSGEWWRLFTSMFLHFGLIHVALNMVTLWSMGALIEKLFGSWRYALLYFAAGICGSVTSLLWHDVVNSAGASGAIFGILGGLLAFMLNPRTRIPVSVMAAHRNSALVFVAYNLLNGVSHRGIDNACHLGGLAGGFLVGWVLARPLSKEARSDGFVHFAKSATVVVPAVLLICWPVVRPSPRIVAEMQFRLALRSIGKQETRALTLERQLNSDLQIHKITTFDWGLGMHTQVVPLWQDIHLQLVALNLPAGSALEVLRTTYSAYADQRAEGWKLEADSAATPAQNVYQLGAALIEQSNESARRAGELARQLL